MEPTPEPISDDNRFAAADPEDRMSNSESDNTPTSPAGTVISPPDAVPRVRFDSLPSRDSDMLAGAEDVTRVEDTEESEDSDRDSSFSDESVGALHTNVPDFELRHEQLESLGDQQSQIVDLLRQQSSQDSKDMDEQDITACGRADTASELLYEERHDHATFEQLAASPVPASGQQETIQGDKVAQANKATGDAARDSASMRSSDESSTDHPVILNANIISASTDTLSSATAGTRYVHERHSSMPALPERRQSQAPSRPSKPPPTLSAVKAPPLPPPPQACPSPRATTTSDHRTMSVGTFNFRENSANNVDSSPESAAPPPLPSAPIPTSNPLSPDKRVQLKDTWSAVPQNLSDVESEQYILELIMQFPRPPTHNPAAKKSKAKVVKDSFASPGPPTQHKSGKVMKAIKSWGFVGKGAKAAAEAAEKEEA